jgi:hypothetical protein
MELDPLYVDVAIRRWQAQTGQTTIHQETASTFGDISATRGGGGAGEHSAKTGARQ